MHVVYTRRPHAQDVAYIPWTRGPELHMCVCACLPRHERGPRHMRMHMHSARHTAIPGVTGTARRHAHRHAHSGASIYTQVLRVRFSRHVGGVRTGRLTGHGVCTHG